MSVTASTSCEAYVIATLHALKHPTQPVMGFLLGKRPAGCVGSSADNIDDRSVGGKLNASTSSSLLTASEDSNEIFLSDAVPIMHTGVPITPGHILEVAYMQCSAIGHTKGLSVVGLYVANERMDDCSITEHTQGVIRFLFDKNQCDVTSPNANLNRNNNSVVLWVANNPLVSATNGSEVAMQQYIFTKVGDTVQKGYNKNGSHALKFARWSTDKCGSEALEVSFPTTKLFVAAVEDLLHETLCDFEEHLENPRLDYCNPGTVLRLVGMLRMMLK